MADGTANTRTKHQPAYKKRRDSKEANHAWASLKRRKASGGVIPKLPL